jgi:hypothetical protein
VDSVTITYLSRRRFRAAPQVGLVLEQEWHSFARWLTWPSFANDKGAHGAWCPAALEGGVVKRGRGPVSLLVADVDACGPGGIEASAEALRNYGGAIVPTFSAAPDRPKHRIVLRISRPLLPDEGFRLAWTKMAAELEDAAILVDRACRNVNRVYYACVARLPTAWLGARLLGGQPIDVDSMLAAAREDAAAETSRRLSPTARPRSGDRYVAGALRRARENVREATEGARHRTLLRESFALARFGFSEQEVTTALLDPFVAVAGASRSREGERAIRDAVAARRRPA